jgi:hypothetical protein|uniref:Uncharacterized protein n=1 Tax=viral metagenome TaxID=1070528 RepID=A0A6C0IYV0_9ZZZZ
MSNYYTTDDVNSTHQLSIIEYELASEYATIAYVNGKNNITFYDPLGSTDFNIIIRAGPSYPINVRCISTFKKPNDVDIQPFSISGWLRDLIIN